MLWGCFPPKALETLLGFMVLRDQQRRTQMPNTEKSKVALCKEVFNQCTIYSERFLGTAKQLGVQVGELRLIQETGGQPRTSPGTREACTGRTRERSQPGVGQGPWDLRTG